MAIEVTTMVSANTPFLLMEASCVPWRPTTLRQLGKDERFLERVIGANPTLLGLEDRRTHIRGPYAPFHQIQLDTPQGRGVFPDIIFLTESGHVVVVEVKLSDNGELGDRRVVAQVLDYAASLAAYSDSEIAEAFGGDAGLSFVELVRSKFPGTERPEELAAVLLEKMRAAELHLVIACDGAPDGLREFVRGVTDQSALGAFELRVVELVPHVLDGREGVLLLPNTPVRTEIVARTAVNVTFTEGQPKPGVEVRVMPQDEVAEAVRRAQSGVVKEMKPELAAAVAAYDAIAEDGLETRGTSPGYRQIKPADWPGRLHYEFIWYSGGAIGVELHLEGDPVAPLRETLEPMATSLRARLPSIAWDPRWASGRGRLLIKMQGSSAAVVAETMKSFIAETKGPVTEALARLGV